MGGGRGEWRGSQGWDGILEGETGGSDGGLGSRVDDVGGGDLG